MKLTDAYKKFQEDNTLREKFILAAKEDKLNDFIVENNLECTENELIDYVKETVERANCDDPNTVLCSIGTFGISCAVSAIAKSEARCGL